MYMFTVNGLLHILNSSICFPSKFLLLPHFHSFGICILFSFPYYIPGCIDGDIRLADGANSTEGRVEVCVGTAWTTICDEGWDDFAAIVICRELGFSHAGTSYTNLTSKASPLISRAEGFSPLPCLSLSVYVSIFSLFF